MNSTGVQGSSSSGRRKYKVFLSFRGQDTANGFTARLFSALERSGIFTFMDNERTQKGDSISRELFNAIEQCWIFIVVFSKNYADSTWCLDQLAKISERISKPGYSVLPIYYDVEPSEVRHQRGNFKAAFDKHEQNLSDNIENVERWRRALAKVALLSGWHVRNESEAKVIDNIVNEIVRKLNHRGRFQRTWKYEVFLSFRGEDTRKGFTAHLFSALQRNGVFIFRDDKRLQKGDHISRELLKAIEQSRISIVVFSKNYADSTWCLEELVKISEVIFKSGYTVVPVFYDVDPSEVQNQSGNFQKAFDKHEQNYSDNIGKVRRWRIALTQVANLPGWDVQNKTESEVINKIVYRTISILGHGLLSLADDLVGMQSRVEAIENLLHLNSDDVRFVGICGMPGIGKTTLAAVVYDKISYQFDAYYFLSDVSGVQDRLDMVHLKQQFLSQILPGDLELQDSSIRRWLSRRKTLIVADNVDHAGQLEILFGEFEWFGPGSRIIITTRDEHILREQGVDEVYMVELLKEHEALQLFCRKAFKRDDPVGGFHELTHSVLQYAKALPLAVKLLGSSLFMLNQSEWEDQLDRLKKNPNQEVMEVLETSFVRLEKGVKDIFVDIACFFKGAEESYVKEILDHCGLSPNIGIRVLHDRSLISIVNGTLWMHDMLQELGRKIAQGEFPDEPAKWSRLWSHKDLQVVNEGSNKVKAIILNQEISREISLKAEALSRMNRLRLLILPDVKFEGDLYHLSNELRYLSWKKFPFSHLPPSFEPTKLVELVMPDSNIKQLWEGMKFLPNLRSVDLRGSKNLVKTPNFTGVINLEKLNLEGCTGLLEIHPSIGTLTKLAFLNLRSCTRLTNIPSNLLLLSSLEILNLSGCSEFVKRFSFVTWSKCSFL